MTDEEFQALMEELPIMDLASLAVEEGKEQDENSVKEYAQPEAEEMSEKEEQEVTPEEPKSVKRKLVLKNNLKADEPKPRLVSKRHLTRKAIRKKGSGEASEAVEISSEEDDVTHDKKKSRAEYIGQEQVGSPTKPGEDPQLATTESDAPKATAHPSPDHTGQGETGSPVNPEEDRPIRKVDVEQQQPDPTVQEETSTLGSEGQPNEEEGHYQMERKRKGKAPTTKKPKLTQTAVMIREPEQVNRRQEDETSVEDYTSEDVSESEDGISLEDESFQEQE